MTMPALNRRAFLRQGLAASAILGFSLRDGFAAVPSVGKLPTTPDFLALALAKMKREIKPGIVIVIPTEAAKATHLANELAELIGSQDQNCCVDRPSGRAKGFPPAVGAGNPNARLLLCQAVFVCLPPDQVKTLCPDLKADSALVLLDLQGKPVEQLKADPNLFGKEFVSQMREILYGKQGERLAATIKAQREALSKEEAGNLDKALANLDAEDFATRQAASEQLKTLAPRSTAAIASLLRGGPSLEVRMRVERIFKDLQTAPADQAPSDPVLPYGLQWQTVHVDPCPGCGQSFVDNSARNFLRFVTAQKPAEKKAE